MKKRPDYYVGLDCGTDSVGWAVTDNQYRLLHAKGKHLWGSRLFEAAQTAAERRLARSSRRRTRRTHARLQLLNELMAPDIAAVDPEFYLRLKKSFLYLEDKKLIRNSRNTLFNDDDFNDKAFHTLFPTIWHLRQAIINDEPQFTQLDKNLKIRLYYLAIRHIIKHRGHFLYDGSIQNSLSFAPIYEEFVTHAQACGLAVLPESAETVENLLLNSSLRKLDKKKQLARVLFANEDDIDKKSL